MLCSASSVLALVRDPAELSRRRAAAAARYGGSALHHPWQQQQQQYQYMMQGSMAAQRQGAAAAATTTGAAATALEPPSWTQGDSWLPPGAVNDWYSANSSAGGGACGSGQAYSSVQAYSAAAAAAAVAAALGPGESKGVSWETNQHHIARLRELLALEGNRHAQHFKILFCPCPHHMPLLPSDTVECR